MGFFAPYLGVCVRSFRLCLAVGRRPQIAGISLSTTSVAVVYAVMIETGFHRTEIGKIFSARASVQRLEPCSRSASSSRTIIVVLVFAVVTVVVLAIPAETGPLVFREDRHQVSEPEIQARLHFLLGSAGWR